MGDLSSGGVSEGLRSWVPLVVVPGLEVLKPPWSPIGHVFYLSLWSYGVIQDSSTGSTVITLEVIIGS